MERLQLVCLIFGQALEKEAEKVVLRQKKAKFKNFCLSLKVKAEHL